GRGRTGWDRARRGMAGLGVGRDGGSAGPARRRRYVPGALHRYRTRRDAGGPEPAGDPGGVGHLADGRDRFRGGVRPGRLGREGADEVVFLDITASHEGRETMLAVARATAENVFIPLTVGGGARTIDDVRRLLRAGADKVSINTAAVERPELLTEGAEEFGA